MPTTASRLGLKPDQGVGIARIEGVAARSAGLQPGDVVLAVGRTPVGQPCRSWIGSWRTCALARP